MDIRFEELPKVEKWKIRHLRQMLFEHMGKSPCFMYTAPNRMESLILQKEERDSRIFIAWKDEKIIAYVETKGDKENFITEVNHMCNICGAYCIPEYRGKDIYQNLFNYAISKLQDDHFQLLGVDFESINPAANFFWNKYFTEYTCSLVRRVDECAINK